MDRMEFTIYFEKPYWIGICVRYTASCVFSSRHIFGSEPSNSEILDFYLNHFDKMKFINCSINDIKYASKKVSYKKSLHKGRKEMSSGSRPAVEIYNMGLSEYLRDKKEQQKEKEKTCREEKFNLKQKKRKDKKRGH